VILGAAGGVLALLARRRRLRIALVGVPITLVLLVGGWRLLRDSSLVSVRHVQVTGVHGPEAGAIRAALVAAARRMTTLDVRPGALRSAVTPFRVVREVRASASFPHGLHIRVTEQLPVAALTVGGMRTAVAADGVVLGPALLSGSLPTLAAAHEPAVGQRVSDPSLLAPLTVLGAAPAPLARVVSRVFSGPKGLTVAMRNGLLAYFGDATRPHAKWLSLARVLADSSSAGASYVDVRLPERPAAGFPAGVAPPATLGAASGTATAEPANTPEAAVAALAAGLKGAGATSTGGESGSAAGAGSAPPSSAPEATTATPAETGSSTPEEAPEGTGGAGG
jgi:cell division protein FtsQ